MSRLSDEDTALLRYHLNARTLAALDAGQGVTFYRENVVAILADVRRQALGAATASPAIRSSHRLEEPENHTAKLAEVERETANISLDTLPFWPWLWADPFRDDPVARLEMAEKRIRINYETAREPIPNQYALVHRGDIQSLMHDLWHRRAMANMWSETRAKLLASEARVKVLREALEPFAAFGELVGTVNGWSDGDPVLLVSDDGVTLERLRIADFRSALSALEGGGGEEDQGVSPSVARADVTPPSGASAGSLQVGEEP